MNSKRFAMRAGPVVLIVGLLGTAFFLRHGGTHSAEGPALPEVSRAELLLVDGRLHRQGETTPFTGILIDRYPDGLPRSRSPVAAGRLHGVSEGFGTNGVREIREHFRDGLSHGLRTRWHANGQVSSEADVVDGKWHGMFRRWDEQGAMTEEVEMRDGEADGIGRSYYPSGFVKAEAEVRRGQPVWEKTWADGEHPGPGTRIASLPVAPTGP